MVKPDVVVFDLGKVLVDFDYSRAIERIASRCDGSTCDFQQLLTPEAKLLFRYESGFMTTEEFFAEAQTASGFSGDLAEFCAYFSDIFWPIPSMVELHETLRAKGFPTYIFSNTNPLAVEHIRERFPFFRHFDDYILSYEHGSMKPEPKIYDVVERITGKRGREILYIDDRQENIDAGAARGWQVILQVSPEQTRAQMRELNLV